MPIIISRVTSIGVPRNGTEVEVYWHKHRVPSRFARYVKRAMVRFNQRTHLQRACIAGWAQMASSVGCSSCPMLRASCACSTAPACCRGPTTNACKASKAAARHHISIAISISPPACNYNSAPAQRGVISPSMGDPGGTFFRETGLTGGMYRSADFRDSLHVHLPVLRISSELTSFGQTVQCRCLLVISPVYRDQPCPTNQELSTSHTAQLVLWSRFLHRFRSPSSIVSVTILS